MSTASTATHEGSGADPAGINGRNRRCRAEPLRILVHDFAGHPFQVQLSRELARSGHTVLHAYSPEITTGQGRLQHGDDDPSTLRIEGVRVGRPFSRYAPLKRVRDEIAYGHALARLSDGFRPEVVLSANTPLLSQAALQRATARRGAAFVYWVQDLLGIGISNHLGRRHGIRGRLGGLVVRRLESRLLRRSRELVVISEDFADTALRAGVAPDRVSVIPNWAPIDELPVRPRGNSWSASQGLDRFFVYLYTGTLGLKHNPELLVDLAAALQRDDPAAKVVVISEGLGAAYLLREAQRRCLANLRVLDYQPFPALPDVLASADVLVALLEPSAGAFSVPSKVLTYLCAGRSILAAVPSENRAARVLCGSGAGAVVAPGDASGFIAEANKLRRDAARRAEMASAARAYAAREFSIASIGEQFGELLRRASRDDDTPAVEAPSSYVPFAGRT